MTHVAVLGGGQLGRMLGLAGIPLGCTFSFLDPSADAPAGVVGDLVVGDLGDVETARRAVDDATVVTFEWEGVPAATARAVAADGRPVHPGPRALDIAQDRVTEKEALRALGVGTAPFAPIDDPSGCDAAVDAIGLPAVLKTRRGGYDGKGQAVVHSREDARAAVATLGGCDLVLEGFVAFDCELSILAVRGQDGEVRCWPAVENTHRDGILRVTRAPAPGLDAALQERAEACIRPLLESLDYVGVCCVELFRVGDSLLANEIAPRVHNSGHWTIEGARTSQFENHIRAIAGLPLGPTDAPRPAAMVNCIGTMPDTAAVLGIPGAHLHDYGKAPRAGRKLGHVTVVADDEPTLEANLARVRECCGEI